MDAGAIDGHPGPVYVADLNTAFSFSQNVPNKTALVIALALNSNWEAVIAQSK